MIFDKIENIELYASIGKNLKKGIDFLISNDLMNLPVGKTEIDGANVFASVSEYVSKPQAECRSEAHEKYIDIQCVISGKEIIGYVPLGGQTVTTPYNPEKDIVFFSGETTPLVLNAGMFAVFFPQDVHQPCAQVNGPEPVKKIVVKVKI